VDLSRCFGDALLLFNCAEVVSKDSLFHFEHIFHGRSIRFESTSRASSSYFFFGPLEIKITGIRTALLGGKLYIHDLQYATKNTMMRVYYGVVTFTWWRRKVRETARPSLCSFLFPYTNHHLTFSSGFRFVYTSTSQGWSTSCTITAIRAMRLRFSFCLPFA
jgi:hypothetical protein